MEQLRAAGVPDENIQRSQQETGWSFANLFGGSGGDERDLERELADRGISNEELAFYSQEYEAGHALLVVNPGSQRAEAQSILRSNGGYDYTSQQATRASGDTTPGMRPDDSSQTGVALNAEGTHAAAPDPAVVEADVQHAENIFQQKYREGKAGS
jgi:hypothetical protein